MNDLAAQTAFLQCSLWVCFCTNCRAVGAGQLACRVRPAQAWCGAVIPLTHVPVISLNSYCSVVVRLDVLYAMPAAHVPVVPLQLLFCGGTLGEVLYAVPAELQPVATFCRMLPQTVWDSVFLMWHFVSKTIVMMPAQGTIACLQSPGSASMQASSLGCAVLMFYYMNVLYFVLWFQAAYMPLIFC